MKQELTEQQKAEKAAKADFNRKYAGFRRSIKSLC